ncbi:MAG: 16S rRNA (guanine(527)-N(7))-methyltransferase RsmG [Candidatus Eremiobacteraeota bacterium]|nr:16S rRNA (guanine(527)-N(7))-methyltransferase RsmG [Candidatus Eremiobacteraeota bacterium]
MNDLAAALARRGAPAEVLDRLAAYGHLLMEANRTLNLTAARTDDAIADQIADAFALAPLVRGRLIDVGSGGGLPGIPLVILTRQPIVLIDATAKKVAFLRGILQELDLEGEALVGRAETLGHRPDLRGAFDHATARAVGPLTTVAELTVPFLRTGGTALLQRGRIEPVELTALEDAALMLGAEVSERIPDRGERSILVLRKRAATQDRFPRKIGVPTKRPLCLEA